MYQDTSLPFDFLGVALFVVPIIFAVIFFVQGVGAKYGGRLSFFFSFLMLVLCLGLFTGFISNYGQPKVDQPAAISNIEKKYDVKDVSFEGSLPLVVGVTSPSGERKTYRYTEDKSTHEPILTRAGDPVEAPRKDASK